MRRTPELIARLIGVMCEVQGEEGGEFGVALGHRVEVGAHCQRIGAQDQRTLARRLAAGRRRRDPRGSCARSREPEEGDE